jgi:hypothetical protein
MDSALTVQELFYLRRIYSRRQDSSCSGVILQNLWNVYGLTFVDKTLLYSVLAWGALPLFTREDWPISRQVDHYTFMSQFHNSLITAIKRNAVSECHLFAIIFVVMMSKGCDRSVYARGLLEILKLLNEQHEHGIQHPLRPLYHYTLLFVRRMRLFDWIQMDGATLHELYIATERLPAPQSIPDMRVTHGSLTSIRRNPEMYLTSFSVGWCLIHEMTGLLATFRVAHASERDQRYDGASEIAKALQSARSP